VCKFPCRELSLLEDILVICIEELCDSNLGSKAKRAKKLTEINELCCYVFSWKIYG
jgi:hypothetical protein